MVRCSLQVPPPCPAAHVSGYDAGRPYHHRPVLRCGVPPLHGFMHLRSLLPGIRVAIVILVVSSEHSNASKPQPCAVVPPSTSFSTNSFSPQYPPTRTKPHSSKSKTVHTPWCNSSSFPQRPRSLLVYPPPSTQNVAPYLFMLTHGRLKM